MGRVAADVGIGLAGTAAITASTMLEFMPRRREESQAPAEAAQKVLGVETTSGFSRSRDHGHVAAQMLTPYPPGTPAAVPGERLDEPAVKHLRSGVQAGMVIPDAVDPKLESVRVLAEDVGAGWAPGPSRICRTA